MIPHSAISGLLKTIRLDDARVNQLLDVLDSDDGGPGRAKRRLPRFRYREPTLKVRVVQHGVASAVCYMAAARDISANGIAFLHGAYLHKATRCVVELATSYGARHEVSGAVVRCRYVQGNVHEVAILFDQQINPALYSADAISTAFLIIDEDAAAGRLTAALLRQFNVDTDCAINCDRALQLVNEKLYDAILFDVASLGPAGPGVIRDLRAQAYPAMFIGLTGATGDPYQCVAAGCDCNMYKPLQRADINRLVDHVRRSSIFSTMHGTSGMERLVLQFISDLDARIRALGAALLEQDTTTMLRISGALKGEATVVGFPPITQAAAELEDALLKQPAGCALQPLVQKLLKLCLWARAAGSVPDCDSR